MKTHVSMVHEGKKPFKCSICEYCCSLKHHIKSHAASVHERKKPFKCNIYDNNCFLKNSIASVHEGKNGIQRLETPKFKILLPKRSYT